MKQPKPPPGLGLVQRPVWVEASLWRRLRFENQTACREAIFSNYHELARRIASFEFRRRPMYGLERVDLEQLAFRGLLEAIDRYDPLRGAHFGAYARPRIKGAISDGLARSSEEGARYSERRRLERERMRSLAPSAQLAASDPLSALTDLAVGLALGFLLEDTAGLDGSVSAEPVINGYQSVGWNELQVCVLEEITRLPQAERTVLEQHYLKGVSFTLIAEMLSLSKGRISQLHRKALEKIRARLTQQEKE
jgi:RNA polymerase sigma factor for flagellar operon FliA